ncbi:MAG: glycosyltransferase family 4 protein [Agathobacter sp.]
MKIVYFTDTFYPEVNGVANTLARLHEYLDKNRIEHLFFAPDYSTENADRGEEIYRFKGFQVPFAPNSYLAITVPFHAAIKRKVLEFQPDIIHIVTEFTMGQEGLRIAKETGIPVVMSYHTNIEQYLEYFHAKVFEKAVRNYFYKFHSNALLNLCPSKQTMKQLEKQKYRNLDIWTRGVDTSLYSPAKRLGKWRSILGSDKFICLYVGRLSFEKGLDYYLEAIQILNKSFGDDMLFVFAGDGPYHEKLENCGIANVMLTGFVRGEMLAELYADADAFVFPSGTETFGNVLLEAMASGSPCVCVDEGGVTDFSVNEENALVTAYRNSEKLAEAIARLKTNPSLCQKLSAGGLRTARERSWDSVMECLMKSYSYVSTGCEMKKSS